MTTFSRYPRWLIKQIRWSPLFILLLASCNAHRPNERESQGLPVVNADFRESQTEIPITQWRVMGPFSFEEKDLAVPEAEHLAVGLNRDFLRVFGHEESTIDAAGFVSMDTRRAGISSERNVSVSLVSADSATNIVELLSPQNRMDFAIAYAAASVESPVEEEIVIAAGADDSMKLWLNGELLLADSNTARRVVKKYRHVVGAKLKKGNNFLLAKVGNLTKDWRFIVTLCARQQSLELAMDNAVNPILSHSIVERGLPLELRGDLLPTLTTPTRMEIRDFHQRVVESSEFVGDRKVLQRLNGLTPNRLYYCRLIFNDITIEEPFYYGELQDGYSWLSQAVSDHRVRENSISVDIDAEMARLKHLIQPINRPSENWEQKVASMFDEVVHSLAALRKGLNAFKHAPGTHIRGYRSSVDGQLQYYWIYVPEELKSRKPVPLVVVLPWTAWQNLPFLEGYHLAEYGDSERYKKFAKEFGFAVLQVWGRGNHLGGTALGTSDVFAALDAVRQDYPVDPERIYLFGYCEGGRLALLLGERYPNRFAAIAVDGPITVEHSQSAFAVAWARYASPISSTRALASIPVLVTQDEADDPPIQEAETFASVCRANGVDVTFVKRRGGGHGFSQNPTRDMRALFDFFKGKKRRHPDHEPTGTPLTARFGRGQGPIEDAFGRPVLVVEGTSGSTTQHIVVHELVEEIVAQWRNAYFVECPTKRDADIRDFDIRKYNLVLVGDSQTNLLTRQISRQLPSRTTADSVTLAGRTYEGRHLGYEFIVPNPLNLENYIVIIGMNTWKSPSHWPLLMSRDGICDYFIFDTDEAPARLREAGYFGDSVWKFGLHPEVQTAHGVSVRR